MTEIIFFINKNFVLKNKGSVVRWEKQNVHMVHTKSLGYFLNCIPQPICLCDGGTPYFPHEEKLELLLRGLNISFETAYNLYDLPGLFDLSKYATLSFHTQIDHRSRKLEKVFDFEKKNLRCLIVQNKKAWDISKEEAKELGIQVIGFDTGFNGVITFDPPDQIFNHPFFFPDKDPHPSMWKW